MCGDSVTAASGYSVGEYMKPYMRKHPHTDKESGLMLGHRWKFTAACKT